MKRYILLIAVLAVFAPSLARAVIPGDACTSEGSWLQEDSPNGNIHMICNGSVWVKWRTPDRISATNGLIGWWKLDESAGTSAADSSGSGNTGTLTNGPVWQSSGGRINGALQFDGVNDYVGTASPAFPISAGSVSLWMQTTDTANDRVLYHASSSLSEDGWGAGISASELTIGLRTGTIRAYFQDGTQAATLTQTNSLIAPVTGQWYHVVATWNKTGSLQIYIDNVLKATTNMAATTFAGVAPTYSRIGGVGNLAANREWQGMIDDVRVYSRVISASEIAALYGEFVLTHHEQIGSAKGIQAGQDYICDSSSKGTIRYAQGDGTSNGLVGWWKLDESAGTSASDSTGNNNAGTLTNGPVWQSSGGRIGGALQFDGTNDFVLLPHSTLYNFDTSNNFSLSLWLKISATQLDTTTGTNTILEKRATTEAYPYTLRIYNQTYATASYIGKLYFGRYDGTNNPASTSTYPLNDASWHHVVYEKNGSTLYLYVDGVLNSYTADTTSASTANTASLSFGARSSGLYPFTGSMDDVRIYNRALSLNEINQLYKAGVNKMSYCDGTYWQAWP